MCPVSAGCPQRTWTWGPHGQGAILLVNCDRDSPISSTVDCKDDQLDSKGKDPPRTNGNRALSFCEAFCPEPCNNPQKPGLLEACSC